ncbi:MAG: adenylate kinase [Thermofilum sp.]|jgi:adenylate kinase|uniref:Adenylate kinase n=2 Tax=Thermofilum adornatum TaxID=1365176 RepID=S5ZCL1_9CREN|nr:adenylate kinase [Thermofilum adornatum]AGT34748.1 adenylate kinase [Thermofilum adornatum]AJB42483.1 Adenylate kinase [Thermofilum adornatum 1505]
MKLVFIGPPGVGKGTYAKAVSEKFGIPHISTGDIFREEIKKGSELGKRVKEFLDKGLLVPDDIVIEVVKQRLSMDDCRKGFILDGFPRTLQQAEALEQFASPEWAFLFQARDETILERLGGRRVCPKCGAIYHIKYMPPKVPGICDKCGTPLIQRKDDTPEVIMERLKIYREQFTPIILFYKERGRLVEIDANEQADKVVPVVIERLRKLYNV